MDLKHEFARKVRGKRPQSVFKPGVGPFLPAVEFCLSRPLFFLLLFTFLLLEPSLFECRLAARLFSRQCCRAFTFGFGILFVNPPKIAPQLFVLKL